MRKLNLCIDIDGTVTEPYYWLKKANEYFQKNVKPKDVTDYDIHKILKVTDEDYLKFYNHYACQIHGEAKPRFGANKMIRRLHQSNNIHFVTAREEKFRDVSIEWLERNGFSMDSIALLGTHNKVNKAVELQSDFFVEDSHANAIQLAAAGFDVILIDCNYNRKPLPNNVTRVNNWLQVVNIIDQHKKIARPEYKFA